MFTGSFVTQWGIGVVVDAARALWALDTADALRVAFAVILAGDILTYAWFVRGWKRFGVHVPVPAAD